MTAYKIPTNLINPKQATCYTFAKVIVPADNTQIGPYDGLWVGSAGDVVVCMRNGDGVGGVATVKFSAVPAGTLLPISIQGVDQTGTTVDAGTLVGLG